MTPQQSYSCGARTVVAQRLSRWSVLIATVMGMAVLFTFPSVALADQASPLDVGDRAIDFELPIVGGEGLISLSDEYKKGGVVVIVLRGYPGYPCPMCAQQLGSLANRAQTLAQETHRVILVYPGEKTSLEKHAKRFMGSRRLRDPLVVVRDDGMKMVERWGLRWNTRKETAYPATYIIDRNGQVRWKKISKTHAGRSSVQEILRELRKL
jgi:peroxiredoxin